VAVFFFFLCYEYLEMLEVVQHNEVEKQMPLDPVLELTGTERTLSTLYVFIFKGV